MRTIKFPSQGTVFDYFIDPDTKKFTLWSEKIPGIDTVPDVPLQVGWSTAISSSVFLKKEHISG